MASDSVSGTMKSFYYNRIEMTDGANTPLTSVSTLTRDGTSFSVSYLR